MASPYLSLSFHLNAEQANMGADTVVQFIESEHRAGRLPAGSRLPPIRVIAHQLGISKNTVQAALEELASRGIVKSHQRQGYFVEAISPVASLPTSSLKAAPIQVKEVDLSSWKMRKQPTQGTLTLSRVFIDPELLPTQQIKQCFQSALRIPGLHFFYDPQGYRPLREAIAKRLKKQGITVDTDDIITTLGSQQGLDLVIKALQTKRIGTENPAYQTGKLLFEMSGVESLGLPINPFGPLDLTVWEKIISQKKPSLLYLISRFQNPTGRSYSSHEMTRILELSQNYGFGILEDDWGSDMLSFTEFKPSMRALGGTNVLYMNSFTKKVLPSLRLGYIAASADTMPALLMAKRVAALGNPHIVEAALFEFLDRGYYDSHLKKLQPQLDARYQHCLEALRNLMPAGVSWTHPGGGPVLWVEIPRSVNVQELAEKLRERQVIVDPRRDGFFGTPTLHGFPLGFAFLPPAQLTRALEILAEELKTLLKREIKTEAGRHYQMGERHGSRP